MIGPAEPRVGNLFSRCSDPRAPALGGCPANRPCGAGPVDLKSFVDRWIDRIARPIGRFLGAQCEGRTRPESDASEPELSIAA